MTIASKQVAWCKITKPQHDKTNKMAYAPSEDSDQPGHPPSLIRVFAVHSTGSSGPKVSSCRQPRLWSDWADADAQADLTLCWAHSSFCWFCHAVAQLWRLSHQWHDVLLWYFYWLFSSNNESIALINPSPGSWHDESEIP